ncbi:ERV/ALR sulfhydryl oxidase domain-containing protein [Cristinia sonorae]|uniref:Sulfhydryl oxidase n=1 Tax=Cristinia sonorae TaxID=1940300 RepID=A0A8K0XT28_9AGAR|nr:ERV/ALR sulfhydryl oxidase domain-containing protein [Cristinia sonorae]
MPDATTTTTSTQTAAHSDAKLPPGMVMGPDGKPCKICTAARFWKTTKVPGTTTQSKPSSSSTKATAATMAALAYGTNETVTTPDVRPENCPPDVEKLGRATWTFLHTTAAYYPERPTPNQRANMLMLLRSLPILYPCSHCASHLDENMKTSPPDVSGRLGLSRWLCERHNEVNERLGKGKFDCGIKSLDERWKDGPSDGSCD